MCHSLKFHLWNEIGVKSLCFIMIIKIISIIILSIIIHVINLLFFELFTHLPGPWKAVSLGFFYKSIF